MMPRQTTRDALLSALGRIKAGKPKRSNGELTAVSLAEEAGIGRATLYRCREALKALEAAQQGRVTLHSAPDLPVKASEKQLRKTIVKLANRILVLEAMVKARDAEIDRLRRDRATDAPNVFPLAKPRSRRR